MTLAEILRSRSAGRGNFTGWTVVVLLGAVVFATALVSIVMTRSAGGVSAIWPADAIILAAVLVQSRRLTPPLLAAGLLGIAAANVAAGGALWLGIALALCNLVGIALATSLYRRFAAVDAEGRFLGFAGARALLGFAAICGCLAPAVAASLASGLLWFANGAPPATVWTEWLMSDALGILVITPVLLSISATDGKDLLARRSAGEVTLLLAASAFITVFAVVNTQLPIKYLLFPAVILPAFRLGFTGTGLVCALVSAIAITGTLLGYGPLTLVGDASLEYRILVLQLFLLVMNLTALPVASAVEARRSAEDRVLQVSNLKQAILDGTDYAIIATDIDGIITHFNAGAARMLGYAPDEIIGKATPAIFHLKEEIENRAAVLSAELGHPVSPDATVFAAKSHLGPDEREWTYARKDGSTFPVRLSVTALRDRVGAVTGYLGIANDITDQRRNAESLAQSRRDLQSVIDNIPAMIAYWDKDLRNRFCNRAYIEWFGKSPDQIMTGMHIRDVIGERLFALNRPHIEGALRGERQSFEREIPIPSGERRQTQAHYIPNFRDGRVEGFYVLVFDISALKRTEAELKSAKEAAEKATRAKSDFLSRMSHELRTPMNSIIGFTELLQTGHPGALNDRQQEYLGLVHFSARHLLHLIDDILELNRIEVGKLKIVEQPVAVGSLLGSVVASLAPMAEKLRIEIRQTPLDPALPRLSADPTRAAEVLLNLGSNAIKYNKPGGYADFSAEARPGGLVRLKVTDNGIGIPPERQSEVFQEFNRLGQEQTGIEGTGIGLALSKRLVELMHGTIGFSSAAGIGSSFWIDLPVDRGE
ncbi:PAS domain S-box protein [Dongia sp. agr-C8]